MDTTDALRFTLTDDHLTLLRNAVVRYEDGIEFGAPAIDPKRPYGNSSVCEDIHGLLGWDFDTDEGLTVEQGERAYKLHKETATALAIVLRTGTFAPGEYVRSEVWLTDWRRADGR